MNEQLIEFLSARIAEDEETARAVLYKHPFGDYNVGYDWDYHERGPLAPDDWWPHTSGVVSSGDRIHAGVLDPTDAAHITRHDPGRVLRECRAKRQIIAALSPHSYDSPAARMAVDGALEEMAGTYANHPDCRPEWRATKAGDDT